MIVFSGSRLSNLVNDILDLSKLKYQNIVLQIKPIEIKGSKNIKLVNNIKEVPPVDADENRVQQILHNLVSNAIKFTHAGTVEISATITDDNKLLMSISDTGIGIPLDKIQMVFNPFEQADSSISREYGGTGLGLSITKQLIELHGGEIRIQSVVREGTKISFTLPLSKSLSVPISYGMTKMLNRVHHLQPFETNEDKENIPVKMNKRTESFHILIVDDDPINLQVLENQLSLENYAISHAHNGQEALDAINSGITSR